MSKVWFITGAGSGIGAGTAKAALKAGDRVVATGRNLEKVRNALLLLISLLALSVLIGLPSYAQTGKVQRTATEWLSYGGDKASSKYSPLDQIGTDNFNRLKVAWTWRSAEEAITKANPALTTWVWESTPLMVDGLLYVSTSLSQVAAIDAAELIVLALP